MEGSQNFVRSSVLLVKDTLVENGSIKSLTHEDNGEGDIVVIELIELGGEFERLRVEEYDDEPSDDTEAVVTVVSESGDSGRCLSEAIAGLRLRAGSLLKGVFWFFDIHDSGVISTRTCRDCWVGELVLFTVIFMAMATLRRSTNISIEGAGYFIFRNYR
jgi:hypothetical protein